MSQTEKDIGDALSLVDGVFKDRSSIENHLAHKRMLWKRDPSFEPSNILLARQWNGDVVGVVRLVPRKIFRQGEIYETAGISSVCLRSDARGKGYSVPFMGYALDQCRVRGFDIALLFARRALDHYYGRFGFWGLSSYAKITFGGLGERRMSNFAITVDTANLDLVDFYSRAYDWSYRQCFGKVMRGHDYWHFLFEKNQAAKGEPEWKTIYLSGQPVGYFVSSGGVIHEVATIPGVSARDVVTGLAIVKGVGIEKLTFEITPQHEFVSALTDIDVSICLRECPYGGHMVRVINSQSVAAGLEKRIEKVLVGLNLSDCTEEIDGWRLECRSGRCFVRGRLDVVPSYAQTAALLGAQLRSSHGYHLDQPLPFHVSVLDHV